ncbi:hypothetical protein AB833_21230 [Chromatiales bacterium (ex Bugula neritina AB1)]|nr:hypothetical protein AB833_21230 [Chromatiales bacterium (ex Bugula neritina AB1)]
MRPMIRPLPHSRAVLSALLLAILLLSGCSTSALNRARSQFYSGDTTGALATLEDSSVVSSQDRLLYWLEKGLILHEEGNYEASVRELLNASDYLAANDIISISDQARTLLANDWAAKYPGESSERLWLHSYLMMNFLTLGKYDSAAVEARQALEQIATNRSVLAKDTFTRALIALSFEAAGQLNDAYIEYRKLGDQTGHPPSIDQILLAQAKRLGFTSDAATISQRLRDAGIAEDTNPLEYARDAVFFVASGRIPRKTSGTLLINRNSRIAFPAYHIAPSQSPRLQTTVNGAPCDCLQVSSDLGHLVRDSLKKRAALITAKTVVRATAKESVTDAIADKDQFAGELARLIFFILEEADTRSWQSLPRHLSLLRVPLPANDKTITLSLQAGGVASQAYDIDLNQALLKPLHAASNAIATSIGEPAVPATDNRRFRFYQLRL